MSHTNSTANYALPQFVPTDKPAWLVDINAAFFDTDAAIKNASDAAGAAQSDATQALSDASDADTKATAADTKGAGALASIVGAFDPTTIYAVGAKVIYNSLLYICTTAVVTPGPWTGAANWDRITVEDIIEDTADGLQDNIDALATAVGFSSGAVSLHTGLSGTLNRGYCAKQGRLATVNALFTLSGAVTGGLTVIDLPAGFASANTTDFYGFNTSGVPARFYISGNAIIAHSAIPASTYMISTTYTTS